MRGAKGRRRKFRLSGETRENHQAIGYGLLVDTKRRQYTDILQFKIGALFWFDSIFWWTARWSGKRTLYLLFSKFFSPLFNSTTRNGKEGSKKILLRWSMKKEKTQAASSGGSCIQLVSWVGIYLNNDQHFRAAGWPMMMIIMVIMIMMITIITYITQIQPLVSSVVPYRSLRTVRVQEDERKIHPAVDGPLLFCCCTLWIANKGVVCCLPSNHRSSDVLETHAVSRKCDGHFSFSTILEHDARKTHTTKTRETPYVVSSIPHVYLFIFLLL